MDEMSKRSRHAIPLQTITLVVFIICALITLVLLWYMNRTSRSYDRMRVATQDYIDCQHATADLRAASDALTNHARSFLVSENPEHVLLYYSALDSGNLDEEVLANLRNYLDDERALSQLETAMQLRERLMVTEGYAMRLMLSAIGEDVSDYPQKLRSIQLLPDDRRMSADEQKEKARNLLFGSDYEASQNKIDSYINKGQDRLISGMLTEQVASSQQLQDVLSHQQMLTVGLMLCLLVQAVIIFAMVVIPLRRQINSMNREQRLSEEGASEIQFLARTYNRIYDQNQRANEKLSFEATHDALTGLLNRAAYESLCRDYGASGERHALMLIDVDLFKTVNDRYGHDVGDKVLKSVADRLSATFRREDMACRIGGDEFAVIINDVDSAFTPLLKDKFRQIAERLSQPADGLPAVTVSAGVAYSNPQDDADSLFKRADLALYKVKDGGRNSCCIIDEAGNAEILG